MENFKRALTGGLSIVCILCFISPVVAENNLAAGGSSAQARLDFRVNIQPILSLQLGSLGLTVDRIVFDVDQIPPTTITGVSSGPNPVPVTAIGIVPAGNTIILTADSSTPLTDGTNTIPFTEISWTAADDFSSGVFAGEVAQQIDQFTGSGAHTGTYTFTYANSVLRPSGTYDGLVTYTLSSP